MLLPTVIVIVVVTLCSNMAEAANLYDLNRKERGAILATESELEQVPAGWRVPSQTGKGA